MTFEDAILTQPKWIQLWLNWMGIVLLGSIVVLAFSKETRRDSLLILLTTVAIYFSMMWLFEQVGYVRLLGLVHVVIWSPLAIYFWRRLAHSAIVTPFRQVIGIFLATIIISLLFDYADVVRYILGERASLIR